MSKVFEKTTLNELRKNYPHLQIQLKLFLVKTGKNNMLVKNRNSNSKTLEGKTHETSTAMLDPQHLKMKE